MAKLNPESPLAKLVAGKRAHEQNVAEVSTSYYDKFVIAPADHAPDVVKLSDANRGLRDVAENSLYFNTESAEWLVKQLTRIFGLGVER